MTREELVNSRQYQITNAAIDYYRKYKDIEEADMVSTFEDGAEWADRTMLDKVCEWLRCNLPYSSKPPYQLIEDLRKAMEE